MRDFQVLRDHVGDGPHAAADQSQPLVFAIFVALVKQHLHAEADAQQRLAARRLVLHHGVHAAFSQLVRRVAERAHAGQQHLVRPADHRRVGGHHRLLPDGGEGALQGEQVAHAIVNDRYHHSIPFVEGISSRYASSMATASFIARPNALNAPSMMWWEFSPASCRRCSVAAAERTKP